MPEGWEWDETLFQGSARYYVQGRPPYAPGLADQLAEALSLDGTGRLLDVGCGPGVVTLMLARHFAEGIGVDPDVGMLAEAQRRSAVVGIANLRWVQARAEELPFDLGTFRMASFAQSFHWMDQPLVAAIVFDMLETGGALVHISEVKMPREDLIALPFPTPPYDEIRSWWSSIWVPCGALVRDSSIMELRAMRHRCCPGPDFSDPSESSCQRRNPSFARSMMSSPGSTHVQALPHTFSTLAASNSRPSSGNCSMRQPQTDNSPINHLTPR